MSKHKDRGSDECATPGCGRPNAAGMWYCHDCLQEFKAEQDRRRGTVGSYPDTWEKVFVNGEEVDYDSKITSLDGRKLVDPILARHGVIVGGAFTGHRVAEIGWVDGVLKVKPEPKAKGKSTKAWADWQGQNGIEWGVQTRNGGKVDDRPACDGGGKGHDGSVLVWTLPGGKHLYGAKGANLTHAVLDRFHLVIDCAGVVPEAGKFVKSAPARYRGLRAATGPGVLRLDWPDMTAPVQVGIRWWQQLLEMLPEETCVCCYGGHGRTGTCLAALLVASGMDGEEAIRTVREKHCRRAIETTGQESYIKGLAKASAALAAEEKQEV